MTTKSKKEAKQKSKRASWVSMFSIAFAAIGCLTPMFRSGSCVKTEGERYEYFAIDPQELHGDSDDPSLVSASEEEKTIRKIASTLPFINIDLNRAECHEQIRFARAYFKNLELYYPTNNVGNCGYVSAAMLLGYYSLLWNPAFLPERFKGGFPCHLDSLDDETFEAPGTIDFPDIKLPDSYSNDERLMKFYEDKLREAREKGKPTTEYEDAYSRYKKKVDDAWLEYMRTIIGEENSIIGYLYSLAETIPNPFSEGNFLIDPDKPRAGSYLSFIKLLIEKYLEELELDRYVTVNIAACADYEDGGYGLVNAETDCLVNGKPFIFGGSLNGGGGHICVAYDYNSEAGDIYGHAGWKGNSNRHTNFNYLYEYFDDFLCLEISPLLKHVHNKAFEYNGALYCSCELSSHSHFFTNWFDYGNDVYHARQCSCGNIEYGRHSFVPSGLYRQKCLTCGKIRKQSLVRNVL